MKVKFSTKAIDERKLYKLEDSDAYFHACNRNIDSCYSKHAKYGYYVNRDTCTRNMLKALRMMPWVNSAEDWARLHVTEAFLKAR